MIGEIHNACCDCITFAANSAGEFTEERWLQLAEAHTGWLITGYNVEGEPPEPHFSTIPCDICGDTLAGDRYPCLITPQEQAQR